VFLLAGQTSFNCTWREEQGRLDICDMSTLSVYLAYSDLLPPPAWGVAFLGVSTLDLGTRAVDKEVGRGVRGICEAVNSPACTARAS